MRHIVKMNKKQKKEEMLKKEEQAVARTFWLRGFGFLSLYTLFLLLITSISSFNYSILSHHWAPKVSDIFVANDLIILILSIFLFIFLSETLYFYFRKRDLEPFESNPWWDDKFNAIGYSLIITIILITLPPFLVYSFFKNWKIVLGTILGIIIIGLVVTLIIYWFKLNKKLSRE